MSSVSTPHYDPEWLMQQTDEAIENLLMLAHLSPGWNKPGEQPTPLMLELMAEQDRRRKQRTRA